MQTHHVYFRWHQLNLDLFLGRELHRRWIVSRFCHRVYFPCIVVIDIWAGSKLLFDLFDETTTRVQDALPIAYILLILARLYLDWSRTNQGNAIIEKGDVRSTFSNRSARQIMTARHLGAYCLFQRVKRKLSTDVKRAIRYHEFVNDWKFLILVDAPQFAIVVISVVLRKAASRTALGRCLDQDLWHLDNIRQCASRPELALLIKLIIIVLRITAVFVLALTYPFLRLALIAATKKLSMTVNGYIAMEVDRAVYKVISHAAVKQHHRISQMGSPALVKTYPSRT